MSLGAPSLENQRRGNEQRAETTTEGRRLPKAEEANLPPFSGVLFRKASDLDCALAGTVSVRPGGEMTDDEFLAAFETWTLPKAEWTHAAHIRMAWLYLGRLPFEEALKKMRKGIQRYNAAVGTPPTAYHETITVAFAHLLHHRLRSAPPGQNFPAFRDHNLDLFINSKAVLARHYTSEHLCSDNARQRFVPPDLEPLPELLAFDAESRVDRAAHNDRT